MHTTGSLINDEVCGQHTKGTFTMLCPIQQPRRETQSPSLVTLPLEISTMMEFRGGCVKQQNKGSEKDSESGHLPVSPENPQFWLMTKPSPLRALCFLPTPLNPSFKKLCSRSTMKSIKTISESAKRPQGEQR